MGRHVWPSHQNPPSPLRWANGGASCALSRHPCPSHQWLPSGDSWMATEAGAFFQRFHRRNPPAPMAPSPMTSSATSRKGAMPDRLGAEIDWIGDFFAFSGHWSLGIVLGGAKLY